MFIFARSIAFELIIIYMMRKIHSFLLSASLTLMAQPVLAQNRQQTEIYGPQMKEYYQKLDAGTEVKTTQKPVIGISCGSSLRNNSARSIEFAGGIPVLLPETKDISLIDDMLNGLDGLMMTGGEDVAPAWYNEEPSENLGKVDEDRDYFELALIKKASDRNIPIFGVCRGLQIINVALGGTLIQDIPSERADTTIKHGVFGQGPGPAHEITTVPGSLVEKMLGASSYGVNSRHHQGIEKLAPGMRITAWSPDSIPEAIEAYPIRQIFAVQFHPESNTAIGDTTHLHFFQHLIQQANLYKKAKDIHNKILSVDTHCDTPMRFSRGGSLLTRNDRQQVSIQKMKEGHLDAQFLAAFLSQKELDDASMKAAAQKCQDILNSIHEEVAKYPDLCGLAITGDDAFRLAFLIGIENGYGIGNDLSNIKKYYDQGVNYITLCHSYDNHICNSSTHTIDENKGLTDFGKKVVKEMNRVGMTIDLSHTSMGTFWDVMKLSKLPVICSHSGAKDVFFHDRNLTDEQLRALANNGGVIQICIFARYMSPDPEKTDIDDVIEHIDHCVKVAGIDHVGIGSDFDGGGGVLGLRGANDMIRITEKLLEKGYSEKDLAKIWSGNIFRVIAQNRAAGKK